MEAMKTAALVSRQYFQLKSGHAVIGTCLHRIGSTETDRCSEYTSQARIDTHHILLSCSAWTKDRRKMHEKCKKDGGENPRIVRQFLRSKKAMPAVLSFIKATRA